mmetsp:Transcript_56013/g.124951  ORF Transcript_56013/g.124951 Transcript_56013/m.124951 type:complete len:201 (+) Transcript_56013:522-1124(+)
MRLFPDHDDEVPGIMTGRLVRRSGEAELSSILRTRVHCHLEGHLLLDGALTSAVATNILGREGEAFALAVGANRLALLHHAGGNLHHLENDAPALAALTLLRVRPALSIAGLAYCVLCVVDAPAGACIELLQSELHLVSGILRHGSAAPALAAAGLEAEDRAKQVERIYPRPSSACIGAGAGTLQACFAVSVIDLPSLWI